MISAKEKLESLKNFRCCLYLKVGNMKDILQMEYIDLIRIHDILNEKEMYDNNEPIIKDVPQSSKDMIRNLKNIQSKK